MKIMHLFLLPLAVIFVTASGALAQDDGWVSLFDGNELTGWTQRNGTATYRVENGTIVGKTNEGSPNSFLCTNKIYHDFELEFEVKVDDDLNSGVQIRSRTRSGTRNGRVNGPQVEIVAGDETGSLSGFIYGKATGGWMTPAADRKLHKHFKKGEWNSYRIVATGAKFKVWLNGAQISDLTDTDKYKTHPRGFVGLQVHSVKRGTGPFEVRWRNLRIRELPAGGPRDDWVTLYDGKSLTGWQTTGNWIPQEDGVLLIQPRPGEQGWERYGAYLWSKKKYKDFILDVEYSYPPKGNSGVYFRVGDLEDPVDTGIEAQILDSSEHKGDLTHHDHGGIIRTVAASKNMSNAPGEWNRMIITCKGNHLEVELNDEKIVDIELDETPLRDRSREGYIGLQDHGEPNNIRFRNIRIKEL